MLPLAVATLAAASAIAQATGSAIPGPTARVSVSSGGQNAYGASAYNSISGDGRYVAFASEAPNLVGDDTNTSMDVFVHDRATRTTSRVSVVSGGGQGSAGSIESALSSDGRFVAFSSAATNLVPGETNFGMDVFVHDRQTTHTTRISRSDGGSQAVEPSYQPSLSADGRYVAFSSEAENLVPGDTNGRSDVFVRDRLAGTTRRVSVGSAGEQGDDMSWRPRISADGLVVAFESRATTLVPGDSNGMMDVFVHEPATGTTTRVTVADDEAQGNAESYISSISGDGSLVAFASGSTNLVPGDANGVFDVFLRDWKGGTTSRVSVAAGGGDPDGESAMPSISSDGRFVAFASEATNLGPADGNGLMDAFVYDRQTGLTERVSIGSVLAEANGLSMYPNLSSDGRVVSFASKASNLVPNDLNGSDDIFVRGPALVAPPPPPQPPSPPPPPQPPAAPAPPKPAAKCRVPRLVGLKLPQARMRLRRAKCALGQVRRTRSRRVGRVLSQRPRTGTLLAARGKVRVVVGRR